MHQTGQCHGISLDGQRLAFPAFSTVLHHMEEEGGGHQPVAWRVVSTIHKKYNESCERQAHSTTRRQAATTEANLHHFWVGPHKGTNNTAASPAKPKSPSPANPHLFREGSSTAKNDGAPAMVRCQNPLLLLSKLLMPLLTSRMQAPGEIFAVTAPLRAQRTANSSSKSHRKE